MRKPVPPASFTTKDQAALTDLKRLRDHCQDLLDWIDASSGGTLDGDVTGPSDNNEVSEIQHRPVEANLPGSTGDVLTLDAGTLKLLPGGGTLAGDVTGAVGANTVDEIQGVPVNPTGSSGDVMTLSGGSLVMAPPAPALLGSPMIDASAAAIFADEFSSGSADLATRGWTVWCESSGNTMSRVGPFQLNPTGLSSSQYRSTVIGSQLIFQFADSLAISITRASANNNDQSYTTRFGTSVGKAAVYLGLSNQTPGGDMFTNSFGVEWDTAGISEDPGFYMPVRRGGSTNGSRFTALNRATMPPIDVVYLSRGVGASGTLNFADYCWASPSSTDYNFQGTNALATVGGFGLKLVSPPSNIGVVFIDYIRVFPLSYYFDS